MVKYLGKTWIKGKVQAFSERLICWWHCEFPGRWLWPIFQVYLIKEFPFPALLLNNALQKRCGGPWLWQTLLSSPPQASPAPSLPPEAWFVPFVQSSHLLPRRTGPSSAPQDEYGWYQTQQTGLIPFAKLLVQVWACHAILANEIWGKTFRECF